MREKSFTLIELLIVIAIIGLLAGITLTSLKGTREKARIARGLQFSKSVNHALGAYAIGVWRFENVSGGVTPDESGYNSHCTITGADSTSSLSSLGNALYFNGSSDYLDCGDNSILNSPSNTNEVTVEAWVYLLKAGVDQRIVDKWYQAGGKRSYMLLIKASSFKFDISDDGTFNSNYCATTTITNLGRWYHLVGTFDATHGTRLYVNGEFKGTSPLIASGIYSNPDGGLFIGKNQDTFHYFEGNIDEVRIYNEALTAGEIQKHYAKGLEKHKLVEK